MQKSSASLMVITSKRGHGLIKQALFLMCFSLALLLAHGASGEEVRLKAKDHNQRHEKFVNQTQRVAFMPVRYFGVKGSPDLDQSFEEKIAKRLEKHGIQILDSGLFGGYWEDKTNELGGSYNPYTGEVDQDKFSAILDHAKDRVLEEHEIDFFVHPKVVLSAAPYSGNVADWDGVKERTFMKGEGSFWTGNPGPQGGSILAYSLEVTFFDKDMKVVYKGSGGLQLAQKYTKDGLQAVDKEQLFQNDEWNETAVHLAIRSILLNYEQFTVDRKRRRRETRS